MCAVRAWMWAAEADGAEVGNDGAGDTAADSLFNLPNGCTLEVCYATAGGALCTRSSAPARVGVLSPH